MNDSYTQRAHISRAVQPRGDRRGVDDGRGRLPADVVEAHEGEPAAGRGRVLAEAVAEREEVVLAVVALALADRAVQPRVEALAVRAPERVGVERVLKRSRFGSAGLDGESTSCSVSRRDDWCQFAPTAGSAARASDPTRVFRTLSDLSSSRSSGSIIQIHLAPSSSATTASRTAQAIATSCVAMPVRSQTMTVSAVARGGAPAHLCSPSSSVGRPSGL